MRLRRPAVNYLFILLSFLLMTSLSYASMGDISICFPFFLLLAFLMAGLIAQGKSPLVGFDISITKPPAEIRSTSYHVKSYTSGGFDTVSKQRDQTGGGTHLTRGLGFVANKAAQGGAKVVSKASGGKYLSKQAREGVGALKTVSQRGLLYTATSGLSSRSTKMQKVIKGAGWAVSIATLGMKGTKAATTGVAGGGTLARAEHEKKQEGQKVKSLRDMLGYALSKRFNVTATKSRTKELLVKQTELKKQGKDLNAKEKKELTNLMTRVAAWAVVSAKRRELANLGDREKGGEKLSDKDAKRLKSLRTELGKLEAMQGKGKTPSLLLKEINKQSKIVGMLDAYEKQLKAEVAALDAVGGARGRATMMAAPFAFVGAGAGMAARHGLRALLRSDKREKEKVKKELQKHHWADSTINRPLTRKEKDEISTLEAKQRRLVKEGKSLDDNESKRLYLLTLKKRYIELRDKRSVLSVFNPAGLSKKDLFILYAKANMKGASSALLDTAPPYILGKVYDIHKKRKAEGRAKREQEGYKNLNKLPQAFEDLKNATTGDEKYKKLKELDGMFNKLGKNMGPALTKKLLSNDSQDTVNTLNGLSATSKELAALYKKGNQADKKEIEKLEGRLSKKSGDLKLLLFGSVGLHEQTKILADDINGLKAEIKGLENKKDKGSAELFQSKEVDLKAKQKQLAAIPEKIRQEAKKVEKELKDVDEEKNEALAKAGKQKRSAEKELDRIVKKLRLAKSNKEGRDKIITIEDEKYNKEGEIKNIKNEIRGIEIKRIEEKRAIRKEYGAYGVGVSEDIRGTETKEKLRGYSRIFHFFEVPPEYQRASATNLAMMNDRYTAALESKDPLARLMRFSFEPFNKTQDMRHIESTFENVIAPMMASLQAERRKRAELLRTLDEDEQSKSKIQKLTEKILHPSRSSETLVAETLVDKQKRLKSELETLKKQNASAAQINAKERELRVVEMANAKLKATENNIDTLIGSFIYQDALLMQRKLDEKKNQNNLDVKGLDKKLDAGYAEKSNLQREMAQMATGNIYSREYLKLKDQLKELDSKDMQHTPEYTKLQSAAIEMESKKEHYKSDYRKLVNRLDKLEASIAEKEGTRDKLTSGTDEGSMGLKKGLERASSLTIMKVGNQYISYADWLKQKMKEAGDPRWGREDGLHRERFELSKLLEIGMNKELQKELGMTKYFTPEFKEYIETRARYTESRLYLNMRAITGDIPLKRALEIDNKFAEIDAGSSRINADMETKMLNLKMRLNQGELKNAQRLGWEKEVVRLSGIVSEQQHRLSEISKDSNLVNNYKSTEKNIAEARDGLNKQLSALDANIKRLNDERQLAISTGDYEKATKLDDPIAGFEKDKLRLKNDWKKDVEEFKDDFKKNAKVSFDDYVKERRDFLRKEKDPIDTALGEELAVLMTRMDHIRDYVASEEQLAEHRKTLGYRVKTAPVINRFGLAWPKEMSREDIVNNLISDNTKMEYDFFKKQYPRSTHERFWDRAEKFRDENLRDTVYKVSEKSKELLDGYRGSVREAKGRLDTINAGLDELQKKYGDGKGGVSSAHLQEFQSLTKDKAETKKELVDRVNELKNYQAQYRSVFEPDRLRRLIQPGSEKEEHAYFNELREDLNEGMYKGRSEPAAGRVSKAVSNVFEFGYKHGGKLLGAAAVIAPAFIPVVGPLAAFGISGAALGAYGAKSAGRKYGVFEEHGGPWATGFDALARDSWHAGRFSPHLTGRGSGSPPKDYYSAWRSQVAGTAYITKGFRVNMYGEWEADKQAIAPAYEGIPWYIRAARGPIESVGATLAAYNRYYTLWTYSRSEAKKLPSYIMQNPSWIPEIEKTFTYQYVQMFGSIEPLIHPKQAWEMMDRKAVALSMPMQEQAKNFIIVAQYAPSPTRLAMERERVDTTKRGDAVMEAILRKEVMRRQETVLFDRLFKMGHQT